MVTMPQDPMEALGVAVRSGDVAATRSLLREHPELRSRLDEELPGAAFGGTALLSAVHDANRELADLLLDAGANIDQRSHWWAGGFGVLDHAGPLVPHLLERGATVDAYAAARHGMMDRLRALVEADPSAVHQRGGDGQTPLHVAKNIEVAGYLLEHGADIDALDVDHESTPAQYLVRERPEIARFLVSRGAKTDILLAAALGDLERVRQHLDQNPASLRMSVSEPDFRMLGDKAGGTIYIWTLGQHKTPHIVAHDFGHADVFRLLMERSPDQLKLAVACETGDEALILELLTRHPDLAGTLSERERRRLADAARDENLTAVRRMLRAGWPLDTRGDTGGTALHWAAWHGNQELAREILAYRPDLELRDSVHGGTALDWAVHGSEFGWRCKTGNYAGTAELLIQAGAKIPDGAEGSTAVTKVLRGRKAFPPS
jgi:ankyrin repeat protein